MASITADDVRAWHAKMGNKTPTLRAHCYGLLQDDHGNRAQRRQNRDEPLRDPRCRHRPPRHKIGPATLDEIETITEEMPEQYRR